MDQGEIEKMREELAEPEICPCDFHVIIFDRLGSTSDGKRLVSTANSWRISEETG